MYAGGGNNLVATAALEGLAVDSAVAVDVAIAINVTVAVDKTSNAVLETILGLAVDLSAGGICLSVVGAAGDAVEVVSTEATLLGASDNIVVDNACLELFRESSLNLLLSRDVVHGVTGVGGIDVSLKTLTIAGVALHELLVLAEGSRELLLTNVIDECA